MDINELENYRLSDAVKFHDSLNPQLWDSDEHLLPEVRAKLLEIADDFREFLGIDVDIADITISGSNAAYTYTPHSDIDLHLVVDLPRADSDEVYRELFDAKKYQYNDRNDFKIAGYDVELYVQDPNKSHHSQGIYSVLNNDWVRVPTRRQPTVDDISVKSKYEDIGARIESAIKSGDITVMDAMAAKIRELRQSGLDKTGEFGPENLAFKILRTNGTLEKLSQARKAARDQLMSLEERRKKKSKKRTRYGYGGYWYPGYHYYGQNTAEVATDGGGDGGGGESVRESRDESDQDTIERFARSCTDFLGMEQCPTIKLRRDPQWSRVNATFGRYDPDQRRIELSVAGRHIVDVLRTLAHEMTHARQDEVIGLPSDAGETGSTYEDQANALAGQIMRHWAQQEPGMFQGVELNEQLDQPTPTAQEIIKKHSINEKILIDQLKKGIAVEMEHTRDPRAALEIALDHLNERPDYYDMLAAVERPMGEGMREKIGAVAAAACVAGAPGCATTDALKTVQTIGRAAQTFKGIKGSDAREELTTAAKDALRQGTGTRESRVRESSGYIPTAAEKNDPRYSMALTADVQPGETGRQANKLGLKTDSQGRPDLLMKKLENLLESIKAGSDSLLEDQDLFEVKMSPGELQKWAQSEEAQGIRAGFEAELIFRDTAREEEEESEPDYDQDERAGSIDDVINFFQGGENGIGRNTANRLRDDLYTAFQEWQSEGFDQEWSESMFGDWMQENVWPDEKDMWRNRAAGELDLDIEGELTPEQTRSIEDRAEEMFQEETEQQWENQAGEYDRAFEESFDDWRDDHEESDWLDDAHGNMSDVADAYGLDWPYWTSGGGYEGGGRDPEEIADSLQRTLGMRVVASSDYHSTARRPDLWIIEPDGSLSPDEYSDTGLEVVSPPMPLPEALKKLREVIDWANGPGDAYTNNSTGLHMGVSLPFKGGDVDYVKLVLFLGDQYVLDEFGRAANNYARSALEKLRNVQRLRRQNPLREQDGRAVSNMPGAEKTTAAMDLMKKNLIELAARYVQGDVGQSKYTSAHIKDGYIEFRSPGGDYLSMDSRDEQALGNTMLRFARAMSIAGRPDLERQEYSKKLYKLLTGYRAAETKKSQKGTRYRTDIETEDSQDALELFARYSTGQITAEELKKDWARLVLNKEAPEIISRQPSMRTYEVVHTNNDGDERVIDDIDAYDDDEANKEFREKYRDDARWSQLAIRNKNQTWEVINSQGRVATVVQGPSYNSVMQELQRRGYDDVAELRRQETSADLAKKISPRAKVAQRILTAPIWWMVTVETGHYVKSVIVQARSIDEARHKAKKQDPWFAQNERMLRDYGTIKPATQKEIEEHGAVWWHVEDTNTRRVLLIMAKTKEGAHQKARLQDSGFKELAAADPDSFLVIPATADEIQQHRGQAADNAQDSQQIQQRVTGNTRFPYTVTWRETVNGREIEDRLNVDAASAEAAVENVRRSLEASGHIVRPGSMRAVSNQEYETYRRDDGTAGLRPVQAAAGSRREYHIYRRDTGEVRVGFMAATDEEAMQKLEAYRQTWGVPGVEFGVRRGGGSAVAAAQPQVQAGTPESGEWTGHWIVRDAEGRELTRFHGIGNVQADANRHALRWLIDNGYGHGTEIDVVPEMR